jgi:hypothetical protein
LYSFDPDDLAVPRSIRTNNPGALNISGWQRQRKGFVAVTPPDAAGNKTTIYRTPEHGVASWYYLISDVYGFKGSGSFSTEQLAERYAGASAGSPAVQNYLKQWQKWSNGALLPQSIVQLADIATCWFSRNRCTPMKPADRRHCLMRRYFLE